MRAKVAGLAVVLVLGVTAVAALLAGGMAPVAVGTCAPQRAGASGGTSQLRFLDARDDHATFTFGLSAVGTFAIPAIRVEQSAVSENARTFRVRFEGASTVNPDGTRSLEALPLLQPEDRLLREVRFVEDAAGASTWEVVAAGTACPRLAVKRYQVGTFARAQVTLSFGNPSSITVEPNPPLGPQVWVSGTGFAPSSTVDIAIGDVVVTAAPTARDGTFEKGTFVYDLRPGLYRIAARDALGHAATAPLEVPLLPFVPDLVPRP